MNKFFYLIFLCVSTIHEICVILQIPENPIISLLSIFMLFYVLVVYVTGRLPIWVWVDGLTIVGISSLIFVVLSLLGIPKRPLEMMDSTIGLYVWYNSIRYL